jgi:hypothetical protein
VVCRVCRGCVDPASALPFDPHGEVRCGPAEHRAETPSRLVVEKLTRGCGFPVSRLRSLVVAFLCRGCACSPVSNTRCGCVLWLWLSCVAVALSGCGFPVSRLRSLVVAFLCRGCACSPVSNTRCGCVLWLWLSCVAGRVRRKPEQRREISRRTALLCPCNTETAANAVHASFWLTRSRFLADGRKAYSRYVGGPQVFRVSEIPRKGRTGHRHPEDLQAGLPRRSSFPRTTPGVVAVRICNPR